MVSYSSFDFRRFLNLTLLDPVGSISGFVSAFGSSVASAIGIFSTFGRRPVRWPIRIAFSYSSLMTLNKAMTACASSIYNQHSSCVRFTESCSVLWIITPTSPSTTFFSEGLFPAEYFARKGSYKLVSRIFSLGCDNFNIAKSP